MFVVGNSEWGIEKAHRIDEDGVLTYFRIVFTNPEVPGQSLAISMSVRQLKAFAARLVLEANDVDPEWDRP